MKTLIKNEKLLTVTSGIIENGNVLICDGKVAAVGVLPKDVESDKVIDATGIWVTPRLIDVHTHMAILYEPRGKIDYKDVNEIPELNTVQAWTIDALNPREWGAVAREAGFITCYTQPGPANVICKESALKQKKPKPFWMRLLSSIEGGKGKDASLAIFK